MKTTMKEQQATGIKNGLTSYMENLSASLFGLEKLINQNYQCFILETAMEEGVGFQTVFVRIVKSSQTLRIYLLSGGKEIKEMTIKELESCFFGPDNSKVKMRLSDVFHSLIQEYANKRSVDTSNIQLLISAQEDQTKIKVFNNLTFLTGVSLGDIKFC
ncbi:MAG: hypothetical protein R8G66_24110 [Cytophagales bacterium]|nr:hypothetical protein [Cytophagales bacterium]